MTHVHAHMNKLLQVTVLFLLLHRRRQFLKLGEEQWVYLCLINKPLNLRNNKQLDFGINLGKSLFKMCSVDNKSKTKITIIF